MTEYEINTTDRAVRRATAWAVTLPMGSEIVGELLRGVDPIPEPLIRFGGTGLYATWLGGSLRTVDQRAVRRLL